MKWIKMQEFCHVQLLKPFGHKFETFSRGSLFLSRNQPTTATHSGCTRAFYWHAGCTVGVNIQIRAAINPFVRRPIDVRQKVKSRSRLMQKKQNLATTFTLLRCTLKCELFTTGHKVNPLSVKNAKTPYRANVIRNNSRPRTAWQTNILPNRVFELKIAFLQC